MQKSSHLSINAQTYINKKPNTVDKKIIIILKIAY